MQAGYFTLSRDHQPRLLTTLGLGVLYWATSRHVDAQMAAGLEQELTRLAKIDRRYGRDRLLAVIEAEQQTASGDNQVRNVWIEDDLIDKQMPDHSTASDRRRIVATRSTERAG